MSRGLRVFAEKRVRFVEKENRVELSAAAKRAQILSVSPIYLLTMFERSIR
jgi:hypothetical protein